MNDANQVKLPDEGQIEILLSQIRPMPTSRFYRKMAHSPWKTSNEGKTSPFFSLKTNRSLAWVTVFIILVAALFSTLLIPSVGAFARQIFNSFIAAPSDQIVVKITPTSSGTSYYFSDPENFKLTIPEAQQLAGFHVKELSSLPDNLVFIGARFDPDLNTVTLLYATEAFDLFLSERPLENIQDVYSIGSSAQIEPVKIGSIDGEFVTGGWKALPTPSVNGNSTPENYTNINAFWDNTLPQSILRWQENDLMYTIRTYGIGRPSQQELIQQANELK